METGQLLIIDGTSFTEGPGASSGLWSERVGLFLNKDLSRSLIPDALQIDIALKFLAANAHVIRRMTLFQRADIFDKASKLASVCSEEIWLGLDEEGFRRKVFRVVGKDLCDTEFLNSGLKIFEPGETSSLHNHPESEEVDFIVKGHGDVDPQGNRTAFAEHSYIYEDQKSCLASACQYRKGTYLARLELRTPWTTSNHELADSV